MQSIMILFILIAASCMMLSAVGEVTVLKSVQTIYDKSPKLRIRGSGFDNPDDILLDLAAGGETSLVAGKDYSVRSGVECGAVQCSLCYGISKASYTSK